MVLETPVDAERAMCCKKPEDQERATSNKKPTTRKRALVPCDICDEFICVCRVWPEDRTDPGFRDEPEL